MEQYNPYSNLLMNKDFMRAVEDWLKEGRLTARDVQNITSSHTGAKIERLFRENRELFALKCSGLSSKDKSVREDAILKRSRRTGWVEDLGYYHGCGIILGIIGVLITLIIKGC